MIGGQDGPARASLASAAWRRYIPRVATLKDQVRAYWDAQSCGEVYAGDTAEDTALATAAAARYALEPYIRGFAAFPSGAGRDVLEIGVGMGADHAEWAKSRPRSLTGIDLTPRAIGYARRYLAAQGLASRLEPADAEALPFPDASFDIVYSWGVLHHSPDTARAVREVHRVLRPGGVAKVMIYHSRSLTGYMLWLRYALLAGKPFTRLAEIYARHLESPGTKAYSPAGARALFAPFAEVRIAVQLNHGDLLMGAVGQRHRGALLGAAKALWPRPLIRALLPGHGLYLLIEARKSG
jgi:SAM-dependent methyltransferase